MKIALVYLIKGKAGKLQSKLIRKVGPLFRETLVLEENIPAHVTLKSPFEIDNVKELELIVKEFVKKHKKESVKIDGFGNFPKEVLFIKTKFGTKGKIIQQELIKELKDRLKVTPHKFDLDWKPHSTVSYSNTKESFKNMWSYLKKLKEPKFDLEFDNITILKKPKKYWKIHKEYKLK